MNKKNSNINSNLENLETKLKSHPVYIFLTAFILGCSLTFGAILSLINLLHFEIEKKGTYIYYQDYYREMQANYIQKEYYNNLLAENSSLKELVDKYRAKNTDVILKQIIELKKERDKVTEEIVSFTSPINLVDKKPINTETEKYKNLKIQLEQINDSLSELYKKL